MIVIGWQRNVFFLCWQCIEIKFFWSYMYVFADSQKWGNIFLTCLQFWGPICFVYVGVWICWCRCVWFGFGRLSLLHRLREGLLKYFLLGLEVLHLDHSLLQRHLLLIILHSRYNECYSIVLFLWMEMLNCLLVISEIRSKLHVRKHWHGHNNVNDTSTPILIWKKWKYSNWI
jgi:hypothetical protein